MPPPRRPTVLITRPAAESEGLVAALSQRGIAAIVAPMLHIVPTDDPLPPLGDTQALVFTSKNAVKALVGREGLESAIRARPAFAVGTATADALRAAGFTLVRDAAGDAADLIRLVTATADPAAGPVLHLAGAERAADVAGALRAAGFRADTAVVYDARPVVVLPATAREALCADLLSIVAFFSPRTARTFASVALAEGVGDRCRTLTAACLSPAVAAALDQLTWASVRTAVRPDQTALIDLIVACSGGIMSTPPADPPVAPPSGSSGPKGGGRRSKANPSATTAMSAKTSPEATAEQAAAAPVPAPAPAEVPAEAQADQPVVAPPTDAAGQREPQREPERGSAAAPASATPPPFAPAPDRTARPKPGDSLPPRPWPKTSEPASTGTGTALVLATLALILAVALPLLYGRYGVPDLLGGAQQRAAVERTAQAAAEARLQPLADRIAALEGQPDETGAQVQTIGQRVTALEARPLPPDLAPVEARIASAALALESLGARLAALEAERQTLTRTVERVAALEDGLRRLETALAEADARARQTAQGLSEGLSDANAARGRLGTELSSAISTAATDAQARDDAIRQELAGTAERLGADVAARVGAVSARLDTASAELDRRIAALATETGARDSQLQQALDDRTRIGGPAAALAAGQLRAALAEGRPFPAEAATLSRLAADGALSPGAAAAVAALSPRAATGIPTRDQLADRFPALATTLLRRLQQPDAGEGELGRAVSRLTGLVVVRRADEGTPGDTAPARIARAEAAVGAGAFARAVTELQGLEPPLRTLAEDWIADATARLAADAAAADIAAQAGGSARP